MSSGEQFNPGAAAASPKKATITYGIHRESGNFVGMSIAEFRQKHKGRFSIEAGSTFYNGKEQLDDSYVIKEGDVLTGHKKLGEKGC